MEPDLLHELGTVAVTDAGILPRVKGTCIPDMANECGGNGEWKLESKGVVWWTGGKIKKKNKLSKKYSMREACHRIASLRRG